MRTRLHNQTVCHPEGNFQITFFLDNDARPGFNFEHNGAAMGGLSVIINENMRLNAGTINAMLNVLTGKRTCAEISKMCGERFELFPAFGGVDLLTVARVAEIESNDAEAGLHDRWCRCDDCSDSF
jgi:hypothetical protein